MRHFVFGGCLVLSACTGDPIEATPTSTGSQDATDASSSTEADDTTSLTTTAGTDASTTGASTTGASTASTTTTGSDPTSDATSDASSDATTAPAQDSTGAPSGCGDAVPEGDEICDDGNADELDGCTSACVPGPLGLGFGPVMASPDIGPSNGTLFFDGNDDCPADHVLVGLLGGLTNENWIGTVRGRCATVALTNTDPPTLELGAGPDLPEHGQFDQGGSWELLCPPGELLVGAAGQAGTVFDQLEVHCAPATLALGGDDQYHLELGAPATVGPQGNDGGAVVGPTSCAGDGVATGAHFETNSYLVGIGLRCRTIDLEYP